VNKEKSAGQGALNTANEHGNHTARLSPKERMVVGWLLEGPLHRWDAYRRGDSCLNTTVAQIEAKGIRVARRSITLDTRFLRPVRCNLYWIAADQRNAALSALEARHERVNP
jgi:hypothetical protein